MARALEDEFYDPVPGYDPRKLRPMPAPADVPRGGMPVPGPLGPVPSFPEEPRETYADPDSLTRSQRYGFGDERDLSVPVVDPRDQYAPSPSSWGGVVQRGSGRAAFDGRGGYAYTAAPAVPDLASPRVPFADAAGESLAATAARGARMQAEQDRLGLTTADMDYIRTYGRAAYDARQAKYGQPTTREDYLRQQQGNLAASVAARRAAENELSRIERDNADERRRQMWAAEQAGLTDRARIAASMPVSFGAGAGAVQNADGGWDYLSPPPGTAGAAADNSWRTEVARIEQDTQLRVKELENQGLDRRQAQDIAARERIQKSQNEGNLAVAQAQAQGRTDAATATAAGRVQAAGIRADAQKYASDKGYEAAVNAATARVEAAQAAGLSAQQVAQIRAQSEQAVAKLSADGALARAGIQADAQKYVSDARYAAAADAAAAAIMAAEAGAGAKVEAERIRAELQRELAAENPWTAVGGGVMGNRRPGETAGRPNAAGGDAKPQVFKMKGADGSEKLVRANADGTGAEVIFEDPDAALAIAEQEVRNLESDRARYALRDEQREDYDRQIEAAKGRVAALKAAMKGAPEYKGPTGAPPTNDAAGGWAAFGGLVE